MPTPTIFEGINPRGTQTLIPCRDVSAFPRSEQAVLGAKNRWKNELYNQIIDNAGLATHTVADGVVTVEASATDNAGVFISQSNLRNAFANIKTPQTLSVEVKGDSAFALTVAVESSGILTQALTNDWVRYTVTITDPSQFKIFYFYNKSGAAHTFYIRNFMLYDANNPDPTYAPPAMTNRELTDSVTPVPFFDMSKTVYSNGTYNDLNKVVKSGIYAVFFSALNKPSDIADALNNATLIVTANPANPAVTQTLIDGDHKAIYVRPSADGGTNWGIWTKFTGTPVS